MMGPRKEDLLELEKTTSPAVKEVFKSNIDNEKKISELWKEILKDIAKSDPERITENQECAHDNRLADNCLQQR